MPTTLQIINREADVLCDLNGTNGADMGSVTIQLLHNPDWAAPAFEFNRYAYTNAPGGTTVRHRAGLTPCTIPIRIVGSSTDNMLTAANRLSELLAAGCVMKWLPNGGTQTRYADIEPSQSPALIDGRELNIYLVTHRFDTPDGVTLGLMRQPFFRGGEMVSGVNQLVNATLLRNLDTAPPEEWAWASATNITGQTVTVGDIGTLGTADQEAAFQFQIAVSTARNLEQTTAVGTATVGDVKTVSFYARVTDPSFTNARATPAIQFADAAGALLGSEAAGTLTTLTTSWQRISVTSAAAPASTSRYKVTLRAHPTSATAATMAWRFAQAETGSTPSVFRMNTEAVDILPSSTSSRRSGRAVLFYNAGDAPAPVDVSYIGTHGSSLEWVYVGVMGARNRSDPAPVGYVNSKALTLEAESMTQGTDTTVTGSGDATNMSGSGLNYSITTFANSSLTPVRLSGAYTSNDNMATLRGRTWTVWARVQPVSAPNTFTFKLAHSFDPSGAFEVSSTETILFNMDGALYYEVPLGQVAVPVDAAQVNIRYRVGRNSGASSLRTDFLFCTPADNFARIGSSTLDIAGDYVLTKPGTPGSFIASSAGQPYGVLENHGPVPFIAQPGVNAVVIYALRNNTGDAAPEFTSAGGASGVVGFNYSPRYYI